MRIEKVGTESWLLDRRWPVGAEMGCIAWCLEMGRYQLGGVYCGFHVRPI
jgi:hypothetical protein